MNLSELSKELDSALVLKKHNAEITKRCKKLQLKVNKLETLIQKVKRDLHLVREDSEKLIDRADESMLCTHGVRLRFDSFINGRKTLKVKSPRFTKSYTLLEGQERSILRQAMNDLRDYAW